MFIKITVLRVYLCAQAGTNIRASTRDMKLPTRHLATVAVSSRGRLQAPVQLLVKPVKRVTLHVGNPVLSGTFISTFPRGSLACNCTKIGFSPDIEKLENLISNPIPIRRAIQSTARSTIFTPIFRLHSVEVSLDKNSTQKVYLAPERENVVRLSRQEIPSSMELWKDSELLKFRVQLS